MLTSHEAIIITSEVKAVSSTFIYEIGVYIINILLVSGEFEILAFLKILIIEILYNAILTIILYSILQVSGYRIEERFKENRILTRYF